MTPPDDFSTRRDYIPKAGSVWLIGDHYHGWMAFERKPGLDNDPEHQPSHVALHRQPRFYYAPGGAWYVKKFLDRVWTADPARGRDITSACPPNNAAMGIFFKEPKAFAPGTSIVSFTLDAYPRQPDGPVEDKVFRIRSHHGYYSAGESLERQEKTIELHLEALKNKTAALRNESTKLGARIDELHDSGLKGLVERHLEAPSIKALTASLQNQLTKTRDRKRLYNNSGLKYFEAFKQLAQNSEPELLVIDDMDMGFRDNKRFCGEPGKEVGWKSLLQQHFKDNSSSNNIIVLLGRSLPDLSLNRSGNHADSKDEASEPGLWSHLKEHHANQTIIIVNADLLRFTGAPMSKRTSWERTAEDCISALEDPTNLKLAPFAAFAHVIVRFGVAGAMHYYREESSGHKTADLYYDSKAHDGIFRDVEEEGGIVGNNSVFTSCIAWQLLNPERGKKTTTEAITAGIRAAIPACQRFFRAGYGDRTSEAVSGWPDKWSDPPKDLFIEPKYTSTMLKGHGPTHSLLIDEVKVRRRDGRPRWYIAIDATETADNRLLLAHDIVRRGVDVVLNNPRFKGERGVFAPLGTFGNLKSIDRDEMESFYAISNIIRQYLKVIDNVAGPMSIAVFGPSGSGKSYTVREIVKGIDPAIDQSFFEINMAQMSSTKELASYLLRVHDVISAGKTPLVFFDEFDCSLDDVPLGWLKYFLAPMEGGTFKHPDEGVFRLGRGIFVFAGGTTPRYDLFVKAGSAKTEEASKAFRSAKGPDFLSRLRGHINVKGINAAAAGSGQEGDSLYPLRRAIILRSLLERTGLITEVDNIAQIDGSLLNALLILRTRGTRKSFRYDTRSLKTVIDMCLRLHGRIEKASLAPPDVLDMHIDSTDLYEEMAKHPDHEDVSDDIQTTT
jgi:ATPase family associated with various cellular activities (AAA)